MTLDEVAELALALPETTEGVTWVSRAWKVGGKLFVDASGQGVILKAPGGACFELTVTDAGALTTMAIACP